MVARSGSGDVLKKQQEAKALLTEKNVKAAMAEPLSSATAAPSITSFRKMIGFRPSPRVWWMRCDCEGASVFC